MTGFSQLFEYTAAPVPDKKRKDDFVDKLKGNQYVKVIPSVIVGVTFSIANTATAEIHQVVKTAANDWTLWGTSGMITNMTNAELEDYITEQAKIADNIEKPLRIVDENGCLEWRL